MSLVLQYLLLSVYNKVAQSFQELCKNWVTYSYLSSRLLRHEITQTSFHMHFFLFMMRDCIKCPCYRYVTKFYHCFCASRESDVLVSRTTVEIKEITPMMLLLHPFRVNPFILELLDTCNLQWPKTTSLYVWYYLFIVFKSVED